MCEVTLSAVVVPYIMKSSGFIFAVALLSVLAASTATAPIAPHLSITVSKGSQKLIRLSGYDVDGDKLTATIISAPSSGSLYQLSQVFSDYGYEPMRGTAIGSVPTVVTGSMNRIVYTPPANTNPPLGAWAQFQYTVTDGTTVSEPGIVWLVPEHKQIVASDFATGLDGWSAIVNGAREAAKSAGGLRFEPYSRGLLNHYVLATDMEIDTNRRSKDDDARWYFQAPAKFLGNHAVAYGGKLEFSMASAAGDFAAGNRNGNAAVVVIDCATCNSGAGVRLVTFAETTTRVKLDGTTQRVALNFVEGEWYEDPKNVLLDWGKPTKCEMVEVLSGITGFKILGDHTRGRESIGIDDVSFKHGSAVPVACADIYY